MRVGIEGSLFFKRGSGVGHYAKRLVSAASKMETNVEFEIVRHVLPFAQPKLPIPVSKNLGYRFVRWFPPAVYFQLFKRLGTFLPYDLIALRNYDAFLFFNFICFPLRRKTKGIIVIHDLAFIHFPQYIAAKNLTWLRRFVPKSIERASHIIAVSQSTKNDIVKHYHAEPAKVSVVPNAVDHEVFYPRNRSEIVKAVNTYGLPKNYIHFHGNIEPRKNIAGILDAYSGLFDELKAKYSLVLSGGKGWNDGPIYQKINQLKASGHNIILTGYINSNDELAAIYSGASLFVWPSFYEGFGVPPLEAMACGVPTITSDNSAFPEVVGEAAIKISAEDVAALSLAMSKVLLDGKLAAALRRKGLVQAKKFTWQKSAKKLLNLLENLS